MLKNLRWQHVLLFFVCIKLALHLCTNGLWSFHRDALLYLALGRHLDWGYASVPPSIGFFAWIGTHLLGGTVEGVRLIPTICSTATVLLTALMAREMLPQEYSGKWVIALIGCTGVLAGGFLRPGMLFQPVVFDVFYWTLASWLLLKYFNTKQSGWLLWLGVSIGLGMLNKYLILLLVLGVAPGILLSEHRKMFVRPVIYYSAGIALLLLMPNLLWQVRHKFPVVRHMHELAQTQFVHVEWGSFLSGQLMLFLPALPLWLYGLYSLAFKKEAKPWRPFAWMYMFCLLLLIALSGKSYYLLGAYPVLIAAGAAFFERWIKERWWLPVLLIVLMLWITLPRFPVILPVLPPQDMAHYFEQRKDSPMMKDALTWEDGEVHTLPQDFADMIGWEEIAGMTKSAWDSVLDKSTAAIYAENYGMAGAIEHFAGLPVISFSDNYRYWLPDSLPPGFQTLIYVNDKLGDDMPTFFEQIQPAGRLDMPLSRQNGTQVYICRKPKPAFFERLGKAIKQAKMDAVIE